MRERISRVADQGWRQVSQWVRSRGQECQHCRECGGNISPLDVVCNCCGASDPARLSVSAGVAVGAVVFGVLLIGLWLT